MSEFEKGMLVQHASLGLGKVVALEPKAIHVFFVGRDSRFAAKLRLPDAAPLLRAAAPEERVWLGGVSAFTLDEASGRYGFGEAWIPHDEAVARFLEAYPGGFTGPAYAGDGKRRHARPARLRRAQEAFTESFGDGKGERRLAAGDLRGLVDAALAVERLAGASQGGAADRASLASGLKDEQGAATFFAALFAHVAAPVPDEAAFEALAASVAALPNEPGTPAWPLVTLLPFLARPDLHMVLRPRLTSQAAHRLGLELRYAAEPNWTTYTTLLRSTNQLLGKLRALGARDLIDVESFLTVVTTRPGARAAAAPASVDPGEAEASEDADAGEEADAGEREGA